MSSESVGACRDGLERAFRRIALARFVGTPAGDRVVEADRAGIKVAGGDVLERDTRCVAFPEEVVAPTGDVVIAADRASVIPARGNSFE